MLFKMCPKCGSNNVKWIIPQNWSTWKCYRCGYIGPIIEGNKEMSEEIEENYIEELKKEKKDEKD